MVVVPNTLARKLPIYGIFLYEDIGLNCINKPKQTLSFDFLCFSI